MEDDDLCCCEYVNNRGERTHLLGLFCDCQELDELVSELLARRHASPELVQHLFATVDDRMRLPSFGGRGAAKVGCGLIGPVVLLAAYFFLASLNFYFGIICTLSLPVLLYMTFRMAVRHFAQTVFFYRWSLNSVLCCTVIFAWSVIPSLGRTQLFVMVLLVLVSGYFALRTQRNAIFLSKPEFSSHEFAEPAGHVSGAHCCTCNIEKPQGTQHCRLCNRCVPNRDHHCVWMNCCIGSANQTSFRGFLLALWSLLLYGTFLSIVAATTTNLSGWKQSCLWTMVLYFCLIMVGLTFLLIGQMQRMIVP